MTQAEYDKVLEIVRQGQRAATGLLCSSKANKGYEWAVKFMENMTATIEREVKPMVR